jgi:hypothetical protein
MTYIPVYLDPNIVSTICLRNSVALLVHYYLPNDDSSNTARHHFLRILMQMEGRAVAQRLDAGFPPRRSGFAYGQHVGFGVDKEAMGQVFSEYFGFPCQSFHRFLHYHNHPGLTQ